MLRAEGYNHIFICQSEKGNPGAKLAQNKPHYSDCKGEENQKNFAFRTDTPAKSAGTE